MSEQRRLAVFGPDVQLGVLFVFVSSLAMLRYIAGDMIGAGLGLVASLAIIILFIRAVIRGQPLGQVVFEGALAAGVGMLGILVVWLIRFGIAN